MITLIMIKNYWGRKNIKSQNSEVNSKLKRIKIKQGKLDIKSWNHNSKGYKSLLNGNDKSKSVCMTSNNKCHIINNNWLIDLIHMI